MTDGPTWTARWSKKAALEHRAREDKKKEEKRKEDEEKKKREEEKKNRKNNEVGGVSTEPQRKKARAEGVVALFETAIVPAERQLLVLVNVSDSPEPVSKRFDFSFQFKGAGKHIAEVPSQCSAFVRAIHGKVGLSSSSGSEVAEGAAYDHHANFSTSLVWVSVFLLILLSYYIEADFLFPLPLHVHAMTNYNHLTLSYDRTFRKALDYELELKQQGSQLVQSEKERTKLEEKLEQQKAFVVEANQMAE